MTGVPQLSLADTTLTVDTVRIGEIDSVAFTVTNTGTDILSLSEIVSSDSAFSTNLDSTLSLAPCEEATLWAYFHPYASGTVLARLTLVGNDSVSRDTLAISGLGLAPPVLEVSADSIYLEMTTGDSAVVTLQLENPGTEQALYWQVEASLEAQDTITTAFDDPARALYQNRVGNPVPFFEDFEAGNLNRWNKGSAFTDAGSAVTVESRHYFREEKALHMATDPYNSDAENIYTLFDSSRANHIGFRLKVPSKNSGNGQVSINNTGFGSQVLDINISKNQIDVSSTVVLADVETDRWYYLELRNIDWENKQVEVWLDGAHVLSRGFRYTSQRTGLALAGLTFQVSRGEIWWDDVVVRHQPSWLSVAPRQDTLAPDAQQSVSFTFRADGTLFEGEHPSELVFLSNTVSGIHRIPVTLDITGIPLVGPLPDSVTFDSAVFGTTAQHTISLENIGTKDLIFDSVYLIQAQDRYSLSAVPDTLGAAEGQEIALAYTPEVWGQDVATLVIVSNAPSSPDTVQIWGQGVEPPLVFATTQVDSSRQMTYSVVNRSDTARAIDSMVPTSGVFTTDWAADTTLAPGDSVHFVVTFAPDTDSLYLADLVVLGAGDTLTTLALVGPGKSKPWKLNTAPIAFEINQANDQRITRTLYHMGDEQFTFGTVSPNWVIANPYWSRAYPGSNETMEFIAQSYLVEPGYREDTVKVWFYDQAGRQDTLRIPVSFMLHAPQVTFNATEGINHLDFGAVYVDSSQTMTLEVASTGNLPLIITDFIQQLPAEFALADSTFADTLAAGDTLRLDIVFTPDSVGTHLGYLVFQFDYLGYEEITLRGEALPPPTYSVSPGSFSHTVPEGQADEVTVTLDNTERGSALGWSWTNTESWLQPDTTAGSIPQGESQAITLHLNTASLPRGTYYDTLSLSTTDETQTTYSLPVTVEVNGYPTVTSGLPDTTVVVDEDLTLDLTSAFADPEGSSMSYSAAVATDSVATASTSGSTLLLSGLSPGNTEISVTATDAKGLAVADTFTLTVETPPNVAPSVATPLSDTSMELGNASLTLSLAGVFSDANEDALTYTVALSDSSVLSVSLDSLSLSLLAHAEGFALLYVTATDPEGLAATDTVGVTVTPVPNTVPEVVAPLPDVTLTLGTPLTLGLDSTFLDAEDTLTYSLHVLDTAIATVSLQNLEVTLTPLSVGTTTLIVSAMDAAGASASDTVAITVVAPPNQGPLVASPTPDTTWALADGAITLNLASLFADPEGDSLSLTATVSDTATVLATLAGNQITLTPLAAGTTTVSITGTDPQGLSATDTLRLTILGVENLAPELVQSPDTLAMVENDSAQILDLSGIFTDPEGDSLLLTFFTPDTTIISASLSGGMLSLSPLAAGTATIFLTAQDPEGLQATGQFTVVVVEQDDAVTGLPEVWAEGLRVYPNPVQDRVLHLAFTPQHSGTSQAVLMDATGKVLEHWDFEVTAGQDYGKTLNLPALPSGFYTLQLIQNGQPVSTRFWVP